MRTLLGQIDLVIECRDYRIPLTSRNPMFEDVLADRQRIIVYTKKDLGSYGDKLEEHKVHINGTEAVPTDGLMFIHAIEPTKAS